MKFPPILALLSILLAGCQTTEEALSPVVIENTAPAPSGWRSPKDPWSLQQQQATASGALADGGPVRTVQSSFAEGTGRFVGEPVPAAGGEAGAPDGGIILNLVNVPVSQAAKTILADMFAIEYTIDPSIDGKMTVQTPRPVSRRVALDLFQAALRANNAVLVNKAGAYRIVPSDQANTGAIIRVEGTAEASEVIGAALQVVQFSVFSAARQSSRLT